MPRNQSTNSAVNEDSVRQRVRQRPRCLVVVAGVATEVGKTWVTAQVARNLRDAGIAVSVRKPTQSHELGIVDTDAAILAEATGEAPEAVCRKDRDYSIPMAPPMAASSLGLAAVSVTELVDELEWPQGCEVGLVESAGGVRSPIATDGDTVELIRQLAPDLVVLVGDAGLGVINSIRLCIAAMEPIRPVVVLNRFDYSQELHLRNLTWLRNVDGVDPLISIKALTSQLLQVLEGLR